MNYPCPPLKGMHCFRPLCQWPGDKNYPAGNLGQISAGTGDEELVSGESTGDFQLKWGGSGDTPNLSGDYSGEDTILSGEAASKSPGTGEQFLSGGDERGAVFTHRGRHRGRLSGSLTQGVWINRLSCIFTMVEETLPIKPSKMLKTDSKLRVFMWYLHHVWNILF